MYGVLLLAFILIVSTSMAIPNPNSVMSNKVAFTKSLQSLRVAKIQTNRIFKWEPVFSSANIKLFSIFSPIDLANTFQYNHPPNPPYNPDPPDGATDVPINVTLRWEASDPDGDELRYDIYFGTTSPPPLIATDVGVNYYEDLPPLDYGTTYYWRIVAKDYEYSTSGPIWSFTTTQGNRPPDEPSDPDPPDGATGIALDVTLQWSCSDPDNDPLTYDVYFGTDANPPLAASGITTTSWSPGTLDYSTTYYWKIVASDGQAQTEGPVWSFTTRSEQNNPPNVPSDPNPPDGETGVGIQLTLQWKGGDPDGDTVYYDVYFGTTSPPEIIISDITTEYYTLPFELEYSTTYYWKIVAKDSEFTTEGPIWSFTTMANPGEDTEPPTATITDPVDGQFINTDTYLITGTAEDNPGGSGVQRVEVSFDNGNTWLTADGTTNWTFTWQVEHEGAYTIMARAVDNANNVQPEPAVVNVTVDRIPPFILAAGFWDTYISSSQGGHLTFIAVCTDEDVASIEIYYEGTPTGVYLVDDGTQGDWAPNDYLYTLAIPNVGPGAPAGQYLVELVATDLAGNKSTAWPYLEIHEKPLPEEKMFSRGPNIINWNRLKNQYLNSKTGANAPEIWVGGWWTTWVSQQEGGELTLLAYVQDPDGQADIRSVEIYYNDMPTGVYLSDDGPPYDWNAGDSLYMIITDIPSGIEPATYLIQLVAHDYSGNDSFMYPYLTIVP